MDQRKKQKTLFEAWATKPDENKAGPSGLSLNRNKTNWPNNDEPIAIDSDDEKLGNLPSDDDQMLAMALEISMREYKAQNQNNEIGNINQLDPINTNASVSYLDHPGPSGLQSVPKQIPLENLPGFNLQAGSSWIYPTNYTFRKYQFNIVQSALFKNTMVVLPTGLGKTFIAAVIMYNFYRWYPQGKVVFMAPTRPLVNQQIEACFKIMGIPQEHTEVLLGSDAPEKRKEKWFCKRVFFLTPQVIMNDISRGVCPVNLLKCLVVDEAHKAQGNHAYCEVIKGLLQASISQFRVIGLSATPGGDMEAVKNVLSNLLISHVELRSEDSPDITPYTHTRRICKEVVKMDPELLTIKEKFIKVLKFLLIKLEQKKAINKNINPESLTQFGMLKLKEAFTQNPPANLTKFLDGAIQLEFLIGITLYHAYELLCAHGTRSFYKYMKGNMTEAVAQERVIKYLENNQDFHEIFQLLKEKHETNVVSGKFPYGHPKLKKLEEIVLNHFQNTYDVESTRVMIFSNYRESVEEIVELLKNHEPTVRAMSFVGQNSKNSKGISQKVQLQVVNSFRAGGYNTLVSTCVGEEGLDIGEIDLIICYDAHKSPIRLVQRIGRTGRKRDGTVISLVTEGKEDLKYNQGQYKKRCIDSALTSQSIVKYLHPGCPRMVPLGINPVCLKMHMTVNQYQSKLLKGSKKGDNTSLVKNRNISNMFDKLNSTNKKTLESSYLTDAEYLNWSRKFKIKDDEIPYLPKSKFLSIPDSENSSDECKNQKHINLSKWTPWQTTKNHSFFASHSNKTDILVNVMQYIEAQTTLPSETFALEDLPKPAAKITEIISTNNPKRKQISENSETDKPPDGRVKKKLKKKHPVFMWSESSGDESCDISAVNIIPFKTLKNPQKATLPIIELSTPVAPETEPFTVSSPPPIVPKVDQLVKFSQSSRKCLKSPPSLDFEFKFPLSPVDLNEIFSVKRIVEAIEEIENSDDGYNSDDEKFSFLQFSKLKPFKPLDHGEKTILRAPLNFDVQNEELPEEDSIDLPSFSLGIKCLVPKTGHTFYKDDNHGQRKNGNFNIRNKIGTLDPMMKDNHDPNKKGNITAVSIIDACVPKMKDSLDTVEKVVAHDPRIKDNFDDVEKNNICDIFKDNVIANFDIEFEDDDIFNSIDEKKLIGNHSPGKDNFVMNRSPNVKSCHIDSDSDIEIDLPKPSFCYQTALSSTPKHKFKEIVQNTSLPKSSRAMVYQEQERCDQTKIPSKNSLNASNTEFQNQSCVVGLTQMINYVNHSSLTSDNFCKNKFTPIKDISSVKNKNSVSKSETVVEKSVPLVRTMANFDLKLDSSCDGFSQKLEDTSLNAIKNDVLKSDINQAPNQVTGVTSQRVFANFDVGVDSSDEDLFSQKPKVVEKSVTLVRSMANFDLELDSSCDGFSQKLEDISSNAIKNEVLKSDINQAPNQVTGVTRQRVFANFDVGVDSSDEDLFSHKPKDIPKSNQLPNTDITSDENDSPIQVKRKKTAVIKDDIFSQNILPQEPSPKITKSGRSSFRHKGVIVTKKKGDINDFLDVEAHVSGILSSDESESIDGSYDKSFVNDSEESLNAKSPESIKGLYIKTTKDAIVKGNKFKLQFNPTNSNSMIFSQPVESDCSDYELDSFCVGNNDKSGDGTPVKIPRKSKSCYTISANNVRRKRIVELSHSSSDDENHFIKPSNMRSSKYFSVEKSMSKGSSSMGTGWLSKESALNLSQCSDNKSPSKLPDFCKPSTSGYKCLVGQSRQKNNASLTSINFNLNEKVFKVDNTPDALTSSFKEMVQPEGKHIIFVDSKELAPSRLIISTLRDIHHVHVIVLPMKGANYIISSRVGLYRSASTDFLNGANKDKIEKILRTMHEYFEKTYLILETPRSNAHNPKKSRTIYADTLLNNVFKLGTKVFCSESQTCSAKILADIVHQEKGMNLQDYKIACKMTKEKEELLQFYTTLPYVNHGLALNLVLRFICISQVLNCSIRELEEKGEISQRLAKKIHMIINDQISPCY